MEQLDGFTSVRFCRGYGSFEHRNRCRSARYVFSNEVAQQLRDEERQHADFTLKMPGGQRADGFLPSAMRPACARRHRPLRRANQMVGERETTRLTLMA